MTITIERAFVVNAWCMDLSVPAAQRTDPNTDYDAPGTTAELLELMGQNSADKITQIDRVLQLYADIQRGEGNEDEAVNAENVVNFAPAFTKTFLYNANNRRGQAMALNGGQMTSNGMGHAVLIPRV